MDADRDRRVALLAAVVVLSAATLAAQAVTAGGADQSPPPAPEGAYPGDTLVTVQAYGWFGSNNGEAFLVSDGEVVWRYDPPNARVFDAEVLDDGNVLASVAVVVPSEDCPEEFSGGKNCVHNRVVELDPDRNNRVVWEYDWYDVYPHAHEVHDADRLPSGETAIIDMGNDRAFTVAQNGTMTWEWRAENHVSEGTEFWEEYVPEDQQEEFRRSGPESDWTHMNDIDRLENGHFTLSIRNFDVVLEVDPATNDIVNVVGRPGEHSVMEEQHNPDLLERHGTMVVADSENDRIVEVDTETDEIVWTYDGAGSGEPLRWPRDADRLPNGNTLVVDSRNFRVLEINPNGTVVWRHSLQERKGIVYDADRVPHPGFPEEPDDVPSGRDLEGRQATGPLESAVATANSWLGFVFPYWVGVFEMLVGLVGLGAGVGLAYEGWKRR